MRSYYLRNSTSDGGGCRGGVRSKDGEDYELEIGQDLNASAEMVVFCAMMDEITEFLALGDSNIGRLLFKVLNSKADELRASWRDSKLASLNVEDIKQKYPGMRSVDGDA